MTDIRRVVTGYGPDGKALVSDDRVASISPDLGDMEDTEIRLRPHDWLIVNGVPHSCRNDLDEPAVLIGVVIGAHHDGVPPRAA